TGGVRIIARHDTVPGAALVLHFDYLPELAAAVGRLVCTVVQIVLSLSRFVLPDTLDPYYSPCYFFLICSLLTNLAQELTPSIEMDQQSIRYWPN
ncbi:MAG TPA: hypothetical protein VF126_02845, partial [Acidobacteriaceae bacterium]